MPTYRNNQQRTGASRAVFNLADRDPANIAGSSEWVFRKNQENHIKTGIMPLHGLTRNQVYNMARRRRCKKRTPSPDEVRENERLIDNILNFAYQNDWQQIDGGVHDKKWVNTRYYPDKIFDTSSIKELSTGEIQYFPVSESENDSKGIAFHYQCVGGGQSYYIRPNSWTDMSETRRGKRHIKYMAYVERRLATKKILKENSKKVKEQFVKDAPILLERGNMVITN